MGGQISYQQLRKTNESSQGHLLEGLEGGAGAAGVCSRSAEAGGLSSATWALSKEVSLVFLSQIRLPTPSSKANRKNNDNKKTACVVGVDSLGQAKQHVATLPLRKPHNPRGLQIRQWVIPRAGQARGALPDLNPALRLLIASFPRTMYKSCMAFRAPGTKESVSGPWRSHVFRPTLG